MSLRIVTAPTVEPITLTEAKLHLRETDTAQDDLITALIVAARQYAENYTRRALVEQTLELNLDAFPAYPVIILPRPPLISVTSVKYVDTNGALTTVAASNYVVDTYREPGRVAPAYLSYWQGTRREMNAVRILYVAGYAAIGSPLDYTVAVPASIKHWMKVRIAQLYEHRESIVTGTIVATIPRDYVDGLLDPYIVDLF